MRQAIVTPLLKKPKLDPNNLKNYRLISNLSFLSKVIERVVARRLDQHMTRHQLHEQYQSAYKANHSVETALLRVQNDVLISMDNGDAVILVLLDLSAAFDTVDHSILLQRLQQHLGIQGTALEWFTSYLSNRSQSVSIHGKTSSKQLLAQGVPQGSVLGPVLFSVYMLPLGDIVRSHNLSAHFYADDGQLYIAFKPVADITPTSQTIHNCCQDIKTWMTSNMLKLNDSKTEIVVFGSKHALAEIGPLDLQIGDSTIPASSSVCNLGCLQDCHLTMEKQVSKICQAAFYHLRNISRVHRYLTKVVTEQLVHAFVTTMLDQCNSLLNGIPERLLKKL
jgi:hypothetical protein